MGFLGSLALLLSALPASHAAPIDWTLILYAGIDEEEIAESSSPAMAKLLKTPLPDNVELLIEIDDYEVDGVQRVRRIGGGPALRVKLPEHNSADPVRFRSFLEWAKKTARGRHTIFILGTHSWGWRGIIEDYTVPELPGGDAMMPTRAFAAAFEEAGFRPDVLILDSCVLGNAEPLQDLARVSRYVIASSRETMYQGLPYADLFHLLREPAMTPRAFATFLPEIYARAYARDGVLAAAEGELDVAGLVALDLSRWEEFTGRFARFVSTLGAAGFRERLSENPLWPRAFTDMDSNADLVEFLRRVPSFVPGSDVEREAKALSEWIGYPEGVARLNREAIEVPAGEADSFTLRIERDPLVGEDKALARFKERFREANQDLSFPEEPSLTLEREWVRVDGKIGVSGLSIRPWLPGVRKVLLETRQAGRVRNRETRTRESDVLSAKDFPANGLFLSEAHTQGAPFLHGIGLVLHPLMNAEEERSLDPISGLSGPEFYRSGAWNAKTRWGTLTLLQ